MCIVAHFCLKADAWHRPAENCPGRERPSSRRGGGPEAGPPASFDAPHWFASSPEGSHAWAPGRGGRAPPASDRRPDPWPGARVRGYPGQEEPGRGPSLPCTCQGLPGPQRAGSRPGLWPLGPRPALGGHGPRPGSQPSWTLRVRGTGGRARAPSVLQSSLLSPRGPAGGLGPSCTVPRTPLPGTPGPDAPHAPSAPCLPQRTAARLRERPGTRATPWPRWRERWAPSDLVLWSQTLGQGQSQTRTHRWFL